MMPNAMNSKSASSFVPEDFLQTPVWKYMPVKALSAGHDESWMASVTAFPVTDLDDHAVGVEVQLADGTPRVCRCVLHLPGYARNKRTEPKLCISAQRRKVFLEAIWRLENGWRNSDRKLSRQIARADISVHL